MNTIGDGIFGNEINNGNNPYNVGIQGNWKN